MRCSSAPFVRSAAFLLTLAVAFPTTATAQRRHRPPRDTAAHKPVAPGSKILTLDDYGPWSRITSVAISPDGKWMTFAYQPNDGDVTMHVRQLDGDSDYTTDVGAPPRRARGFARFRAGGGGGPTFSDDSRWVGYYVNPPTPDSSRRGARPGGPGRPGRGAGAARGGRTARSFELVQLATGEKTEIPNVASFHFSGNGRWLAVRLNREGADTSVRSGDLILRELATGMTRNIGNVDQYDFDDAGTLFAYTVDAADRLGNGIYVLDLTKGTTTPLNTGQRDYAQLTWSDSGTNLAALSGDTVEGKRWKANILLAWTDVGTSHTKAVSYDPTQDRSFPDSLVVSEFGSLSWSPDGKRVFLGLKWQEPAMPNFHGRPHANVDVWHWNDGQVQSVQMVRLQQELHQTFEAAFQVASGKLVPLADSAMPVAQPTQDGKWAIGRLDAPYRREVTWGGGHADYYRVNTATGARTLIAKKLIRTMGASPDSRWFLYLQNRHVYAYDLDAGKATRVGGDVNFVNTDDDHPYELPIWGLAGWTKDGRAVLLYTKYDLWRVPLNGAAPVDLTKGAGAKDSIQYRLVRFDKEGRPRGGPRRFSFGGGTTQDTPVDLTKPLLLSAYGEWTKKSGYWRLAPGGTPTRLIWADKMIGDVQKASDADRMIFTQQTFREFPDYWVSDGAFKRPRKVTDANPQLKDYAWGSKVLINYTNSKGRHLQATLTLPANYQPGKRYPMLVYFYEILSNTHHRFSMPVYDDRPHMSEYASGGYLVLEPDVVYTIGRPGSSAVDCVTSAVRKVIALGYADSAHIGLQGHSWGGYQSSYILTQTNLFAAVVTGAPPTDLISFYDELYPGTGTVQQGISEVGQVRLGRDSTPWTARELYEDQSPVFNVRKIQTPFLILQGTADNAVDWHQGLEYYNAARRNGKKVIFLSYPGEPHHLAKKENQIDFQIRMRQFFDHYLMGKPAPDWMVDGVPQTEKGRPIH